jgi:hypothetical protein
MLQTLSFDIADMWCCVEEDGPWCWVLQTLNFNVADVEFRCCRHVMLGFVSMGRGRRAPDVECCTQYGSQHGHNIVATWRGERKTPDVGRCTPCCSQHATHKLATLIATSFVECCKHTGSQHGKSSSQHRKSCSQYQHASQHDRRLIRPLI